MYKYIRTLEQTVASRHVLQGPLLQGTRKYLYLCMYSYMQDVSEKTAETGGF